MVGRKQTWCWRRSWVLPLIPQAAGDCEWATLSIASVTPYGLSPQTWVYGGHFYSDHHTNPLFFFSETMSLCIVEAVCRSLCYPRWPRKLPASMSQVLGLHTCTRAPNWKLLLFTWWKRDLLKNAPRQQGNFVQFSFLNQCAGFGGRKEIKVGSGVCRASRQALWTLL